jgi:hypothetical protein
MTQTSCKALYLNCFPISTSVNVHRCYDVTWRILLLKPCGFSWYLSVCHSIQRVCHNISVFKGYGLPLSFNITWPCQLIRGKHYYTLFSVPCSYLHLQEIRHYYRKIKFIAIKLEAISWTSLSEFNTYQSIIFNIILFFTLKDKLYVCNGLLYLFTGWILDELQKEWIYFIWYSSVISCKISRCLSHMEVFCVYRNIFQKCISVISAVTSASLSLQCNMRHFSDSTLQRYSQSSHWQVLSPPQ